MVLHIWRYLKTLYLYVSDDSSRAAPAAAVLGRQPAGVRACAAPNTSSPAASHQVAQERLIHKRFLKRASSTGGEVPGMGLPRSLTSGL